MGYPADYEEVDIVFTAMPGPVTDLLNWRIELPGYATCTVEAALDAMSRARDGALGPAQASAYAAAILTTLRELKPATFIEVEDGKRRSLRVGEWVVRDDDRAVLRLRVNENDIKGRS